MQLVVLALSFLLGITTAHVRLTFPPARKFDFDFLDNVRTSGPCGMESDYTQLTVLEKGSTINVTWHLAYSHRGGFRLELINGTTGTVLANLTESNFTNDDAITTTSYEVTLPADFEGVATLRLIRHAREWTTSGGGPYIFWSCADVDIKASSTCNGACTPDDCENGVCTSCSHLSSGIYCQYQDDCAGSDDCNGNGECWRVSATTYPRQQCFCSEGFFGRKCENANPSDFTLDIEKSKYFERTLSDPGFKIYYRIREKEAEIEIAIEATSSTWAAVGWKPTTLNATCQNFPVQYRTGEPISEPEATATEEPLATVPSGRRRRRGSADLQADIQLEQDNPYSSNWTCDPSEWTGPVGEPEAEPGTPEAEPEVTSEPEVTAEPEGTGEPEPESEPESTPDIHPMNCADVIIGRAKGRLGNVGDYYTRDRSTPRRDKEFYNGADDLVAAGAKEENGKTTVVFRRKLTTTDQADHDIEYRVGMDVVWAKGQEIGQEIHSPASGLESCEAKTPLDYWFYRKDEIKYHGKHSAQRGLWSGLDFYADPNTPASGNCAGSLGLPDGCTGSDCDYRIQWRYVEAGDKVEFNVIAAVGQDKWTGVGFSESGRMPGSDAIIAWYDGTTGFVKDYYLENRVASKVVVDGKSDISEGKVDYVDGELRVSFTRKRDTGDAAQDAILDDKSCVYFLLPDQGGTRDASGISKHAGRPSVSSSKICLGPCVAEVDPDCPEGVGCSASGLLSSIFLLTAIILMKNLIHG